MAIIKVDTSKQTKQIKPMHAMGQPPFVGGFRKFDFTPMKHLQNANVPYSRLHDVGGAFGGNRFVDIGNIFRDWSADETDPASYSFAFTDHLLAAMQEYDLKPIFRLGETIENQMTIEPIRIHPPKDYAKWARICEHIIRHYNEGWAGGYRYGIEYWEIWNEPENGPTPELNQMWTGTAEQYFALYDVTARHLRACFGDSIKIGGYGSCGFGGIFYHPEKYGIDYPAKEIGPNYEKDTYRVTFLLDFLKYVREHRSPIDFFSWHSYYNVEKTVIMDEFLHQTLTEYGFGDLETHLNEWNNANGTTFGLTVHGSSFASASVASMMLAMQDAHTDMLCYYDSRLQASSYGGLFAPLTGEPVCTYYSFVAFGRLYALGTQVECRIDCAQKGLYAVAATDGKRHALMISNQTGETQALQPEGVDLAEARIYTIDQRHLLSMAFDATEIKNDTVLLIEW